MPRTLRIDTGEIVYHVLNRATSRLQIFKTNKDFLAFEATLIEAKEKYPMRLLAYCLMPNHWHLVVHPEKDGQLIPFMRWLSMTHTHRWHAAHDTTGTGHVYQGRYKSFPVQEDEHFLQLVRYVERNALRAGLVAKAEAWPWSSLYRRVTGTEKQKKLLDAWPVEPTKNYLEWINTPQPKEEVELIRMSVKKGRPYGGEKWSSHIADKLGLGSTFHSKGRPKKV